MGDDTGVLLRDNLRRMLAEHGSPERVRTHVEERRWDEGLWGHLCEIGVLGLVPEAEDESIAHALIAHEELGRALSPVPALSVGAALHLLRGLGRTDAADAVERGDVRWSLLLAGTELSWSLSPGVAGPAPRDAGLVAFAEGIDAVLVATVGGEARELRAVPVSRLDLEPIETLDASFPLSRVAPIDPSIGAVVGSVSARDARRALEATRAFSRAALCAEMLGGAERCLDDVVAFLKTREQFGRPIGAFQALQHSAADMAIRLEAMRAFVAALEDVQLDAEDPASQRAKAYVSDAYCFVAKTCLQLYGGIGFTWEHDVHLHLRRARRCAQMLGAPAAMRARHVHALGRRSSA